MKDALQIWNRAAENGLCKRVHHWPNAKQRWPAKQIQKTGNRKYKKNEVTPGDQGEHRTRG